MKIGIIGFPKIGGGYSRFLYLKNAFPNYKFFLIHLGNCQIPMDFEEEDFIRIGEKFDKNTSKRILSKLLIDFCDNNIDILIPMNSPIAIGCIPFFKFTKIIQITNSDTPRVYKYVSTHFQYVSRIICISPKQLKELKSWLPKKVSWGKMQLIPHGVKWMEKLDPDSNPDLLTIGFLGRFHQGHKGVFFIPEILKSLSIPFRLELIGNGNDKERLFELLDQYHIPYISHGVVNNNQLNQYLKNWDVLLFPSVVEGFGLTLIEGMNNGVVPISNHLPGVTDYIIENGGDGFIVPNNKVSMNVQKIHFLNDNRDILRKMKLAANKTIENKFNLDKIIRQYESLFLEVVKERKPGKVMNFQDWNPYQEYKPKLLNRIKHKIYTFFQ